MSLNAFIRPFGAQNFSLTELCNSIDADSVLRQVQTVKTYAYVERKRLAPHRCLVLKLQGHDASSGWLCLDRRPTSGSDLASGKGKTKANDQVTLSDWTLGNLS